MDASDGAQEGLRRRAKIGHRKSRNGCKSCKSRRVKCDETRPVCANCTRLGLACLWPNTSGTPKAPNLSPPGSSSTGSIVDPLPSTLSQNGPGRSPDSISLSQLWALGESSPRPESYHGDGIPPPVANEPLVPSFNSAEEIVLPESRTRRMLEHRLMQHYILNMAKPFPVSAGPAWIELFGKKVPQLALQYDNVLFILLANAANNLLRRLPDDAELFTARHTYLISAIREQRKMVSSLTTETADPVCLSALLLLVHSWAALQDRPLEPYSPPIDWFSMGRGAGVLIWMSMSAIKNATEEEKARSCLMVVANSYPRFGDDESYFDPKHREMFNGVLTQKLPSGDTWDDETRETYEKALSYVGSIQSAIDHGEPVYALYRRIQCFGLVLPRRFIDLLQELRPRALVILAHFFATVAQVPGTWWIGDGEGGREPTAKREIRAISKVLPDEWQVQMVWPLDITGLR
ncbi:hypothetical protein B0H66DRAFT_73693 [Apodospora peruviana]|uniref:Zn(2)-C6 fungal-type domain-containing protein n=1 Tax=Apodospora peruviana TaxID=516989 RepID=A0AAE0ITN2_9PEZI|nr:hypothetical protein B0H66DRAFT_73693 [Apodospora peruviana]